MRFRSLKFKIILSSAVCILVVGVFSSAVLYYYLTGIIAEKSDRIDLLNLESVQAQINRNLGRLYDLGNLCSNDLDIARAMRYDNLVTTVRKRDALRAQEILKVYLSASAIKDSANKLMAFNESGVTAQAVTGVLSSPLDPEKVMELDLFRRLRESGARELAAVSSSIVDGSDCIAYVAPIYDYATSRYQGWLYIELATDWIVELTGEQSLGSAFVVFGDRPFPAHGYPDLPDVFFPLPGDGEEVRLEERIFKLHSVPLRLDGLRLCSRSDVTFLAQDGRPIRFTVLVVVATSLAVAMVLSFVLSGVIMRPLQRLSARIRKIAANDFSYDASIEQGGDEIADTGRMVNEMSGSIQHLLAETEEMYQQRKNAEIALLQSQVNPHFLYNTLDSIHWMATIQKNTGIAKVTRSLSSLLRNLAKGVGDKIPLGEELSLLRDYVEIQSVRYLETFRFDCEVDESLLDCHIVKFTLQPLVENAFFHGIEPTGRFGTVTVGAREEREDLLITVEDDGVGMSREEIDDLLASTRNPLRSGLSGIGVANVHNRLRLVYGSHYGLTYESEKGRYTRVTVRIPRETGQPAKLLQND